MKSWAMGVAVETLMAVGILALALGITVIVDLPALLR